MRKLVSYLFFSLDGVVNSPERWAFDHVDAELAALPGSHDRRSGRGATRAGDPSGVVAALANVQG